MPQLCSIISRRIVYMQLNLSKTIKDEFVIMADLDQVQERQVRQIWRQVNIKSWTISRQVELTCRQVKLTFRQVELTCRQVELTCRQVKLISWSTCKLVNNWIVMNNVWNLVKPSTIYMAHII